MLAQYLDLTDEFRSNGFVKFEVSNYDYALVQFTDNVNNDSMIFSGTLDSGAVQGVTDGNISTSTNYVPISALDLHNGTYVSSSLLTEGMFKFDVVSRYIKIETDGGVQEIKVFVMLAKIS